MVFIIHVDEIDNDNAAQIADAKLARDGVGRFQIGLENRVMKTATADKATGVYIDTGQRFGLVNDQIATRFEVDPTR